MELKLSLLLLITIGLVDSESGKTNLRFPFDLPKGFGPWLHPTVGQVWPQPHLQESTNNFMVLRPNSFEFQVYSR